MDLNARLARWWTLAGGLPGVMVGALPLVLEIVSPQRAVLSVIIAVAYLATSVAVARPRRIDLPVLIYAVAALAFVGLSMLRAEFLDPLNVAQRSYGLAKATYFLAAVLPLSVAVAFLVSRVDDLKPAVFVFVVLGVIVAAITVPLRDNELFGVSRYTVQGNVMAVAGLLLAQFWLVRDFRWGAALILLCFVGVLITESRQSVAAVIVGLAATGIFWFGADRSRTRTWVLPAVIFGAALATLAVWALLVWEPWIPLPRGIKQPIHCNCVAGRFIDVLSNPGGRNVLLEQGWAQFISHPIFGAGLGAFVGHGPYPYPHNIELEVAGELGLVGVAILLLPLVVGWVRLAAVGLMTASQAIASALVLVLMYAVVANLSGDLASQRGLWVFGLALLKLGWRRNPLEAPA